MIYLKIGQDQIDRARVRYDFHNLKDSITKGASEIYGALGEVLFEDYCATRFVACEYVGCADYDFLVGGKKVDVKTKRTTVTPRLNYNCSVAAFNTRQKTDFYCFLRVHENLKDAWFLGHIKKADFFGLATFNKMGEPDGGGFKFRADCYNLPVSKLSV